MQLEQLLVIFVFLNVLADNFRIWTIWVTRFVYTVTKMLALTSWSMTGMTILHAKISWMRLTEAMSSKFAYQSSQFSLPTSLTLARKAQRKHGWFASTPFDACHQGQHLAVRAYCPLMSTYGVSLRMLLKLSSLLKRVFFQLVVSRV